MPERLRGLTDDTFGPDPAPVTQRNGILILCGDSDGNLGDRAILQGTCEAIRRIDPDVPIFVVSGKPERTSTELGVTALAPGVGGLVRLWAAARRSRVVLVGGGGLFQDDDSLIKMPYWAARCVFVRAAGARVVGHSLGVGPLAAFTSRLSARVAFATMDRVSVRDPLACETARSLARTEVLVVPDPAFTLSSSEIDGSSILGRAGVPPDEGPLIGVTLRRWFPPRPRLVPYRWASRLESRESREAKDGPLVAAWAEALDRVLGGVGGRVVMLPTYTVAHEGDDRLCSRVRESMRYPDRAHLLRLDTPAEYVAVAERLSVMVSGRMHPLILAAVAGVPVVGVAYNPKFEGVFRLLEADDQWLSVEDLVEGHDVDRLVDMVLRVLERSDSSSAPARALASRTHAWLEDVLAWC